MDTIEKMAGACSASAAPVRRLPPTSPPCDSRPAVEGHRVDPRAARSARAETGGEAKAEGEPGTVVSIVR